MYAPSAETLAVEPVSPLFAVLALIFIVMCLAACVGMAIFWWVQGVYYTPPIQLERLLLTSATTNLSADYYRAQESQPTSRSSRSSRSRSLPEANAQTRTPQLQSQSQRPMAATASAAPARSRSQSRSRTTQSRRQIEQQRLRAMRTRSRSAQQRVQSRSRLAAAPTQRRR